MEVAIASSGKTTLGHYQLLDEVGSGAMGRVFRAHDTRLDRIVALKLLSPDILADENARERFRNEALLLSRLSHPNIATIHDFDSSGGVDFLVTEYIGGEPLEAVLRKQPMAVSRALEMCVQLAEGLASAHEQGVLHRDLKPANVGLTSDGRPKLLDFGLALPLPALAGLDAADTVADLPPIAGTVTYMAPEILRGGPPSVRSDLYSLGALLYEVCTGRPPFTAPTTVAVAAQILHEQVLAPSSVRPELPPELDAILLRCLEKLPGRRYENAATVGAQLHQLLQAGPQAGRSIAVLYFEQLGPAEPESYFRDGVTEDIGTELSKIQGLRVFSRSAVLQFKDKPVTPYYVGQQLAAAYVVEGSIRRDEHRLRVTARLVNTTTGHTLWANRFDEKLQDVFAVQDEIAHSVAAALRVVLTPRERDIIAKRPTKSIRAYELYLRGRGLFHEFRRRGIELAAGLFQTAIAEDPEYARAYAGLADCYAFLYLFWESTPENLSAAEEASRAALRIDPALAEAHTSKGLTASLGRRYAEAQQEFEQAIQLDPSLFEPYYFSGRNFYVQGRMEEAVLWFARASRVRPEDYQAPMLMGSALHGLQREADAADAYRRGLLAAERHLQLHPEDSRAFYFGAIALTQLHDPERAIVWAERALELEAGEPQVLYNIACVFALLGQVERSLDCLERSVTRAWAQKEWMEHDPDLDAVRSHPRFQAIMAALRS